MHQSRDGLYSTSVPVAPNSSLPDGAPASVRIGHSTVRQKLSTVPHQTKYLRNELYAYQKKLKNLMCV